MKYNEYKLKCDITNFIHAPSHSKEESLWCLLKWKWHLFKCMVPITDNQMIRCVALEQYTPQSVAGRQFVLVISWRLV